MLYLDPFADNDCLYFPVYDELPIPLDCDCPALRWSYCGYCRAALAGEVELRTGTCGDCDAWLSHVSDD